VYGMRLVVFRGSNGVNWEQLVTPDG